MSQAIIGRKIGMTSVFTENGESVPVTVIEAPDNVITQIKTVETDGYEAVQIGYGARKEKKTTKALKGHFEKSGTEPKIRLNEFNNLLEGAEAGDSFSASDLFSEGERVDVIGTSKGKGFQGVVKRHGFAGVGGATHGQHNRDRAPGSIGAASTPSRVFKGMKMGGRMGGERVTVQNIEIVRIVADKNLVLVRGAVPGPNKGIVAIRKRITTLPVVEEND
ncbi:MAG: 50S ribosomal protein L3 [Rhodothermales bacterium]|nr:50S ribosomal protein L3 [Rhodothermales bacterium]